MANISNHSVRCACVSVSLLNDVINKTLFQNDVNIIIWKSYFVFHLSIVNMKN
jgi:hypothetical protein